MCEIKKNKKSQFKNKNIVHYNNNNNNINYNINNNDNNYTYNRNPKNNNYKNYQKKVTKINNIFNNNTLKNSNNFTNIINSTPRKDEILIDSSSLISLCSPFTIPNDTHDKSFKVIDNRYNNNNNQTDIDLSIIYGDLTKSFNNNNNKIDSNYKILNKQKLLGNLFDTLNSINKNNNLDYGFDPISKVPNLINSNDEYITDFEEQDNDDSDSDFIDSDNCSIKDSILLSQIINNNNNNNNINDINDNNINDNNNNIIGNIKIFDDEFSFEDNIQINNSSFF